MKYNIVKESLVYDGFLKIKEALITHDRFHENTAVTYTREVLDKGPFVAVLLYEKDTDQLVFINQFRYPTIKNGTGWLFEIPAGGIEGEEDPIQSAIREVEEETGYVVTDLHHILSCYMTPGISSERMYLYYGEVVQSDKKNEGGGAVYEDEDIKVCKYPAAEIKTLLMSEVIDDAKSIIALQWFMINKLNGS
ncbi:NUDIX domain-containing protein [Aquimarina celericrescens]|uniref:GDP-mannose pyrophosphatase n=1 Tax=Aquimarina celericrescens TaxID=1964542 RepID=A0ABW5ATJ3_9FLAO|nr:NUDIX hydrolase [Aquimarina celericrescens]